jgi:threonine/homoserine/homoserine lactone efflux protein
VRSRSLWGAVPTELTFLVLGAGIGFVAGVSPGPVLTLVVGETLRGGWARGAAVATGPLLADGPIVVLAVVLVGQLPAELVPALSFVGGIFLLYLATTMLLNARTAQRPGADRPNVRRGLLTGLLARALSPNPYLFWMLIGAPTLVAANTTEAAAFVIGYYASIVGSNVGLAIVLHRWIAVFSAGVYRQVLFVSGLLLAVYGVVLLGRGAQALKPTEPAP